MTRAAPIVRAPRDVVVLVNPSGQVTGHAEKLSAHQPPGALHLAFSVFLFRADGSTLLQQRAASKYHFPLYWANACCSHPGPAEEVAASARARVEEELGLRIELALAGSFIYRARDPLSSMVEHELDHVFVGVLETQDLPPEPDPAEVAALCFVQPAELLEGRFSSPLAPWVLEGLELALAHLERAPTAGVG